jgi:hypothetical protein
VRHFQNILGSTPDGTASVALGLSHVNRVVMSMFEFLRALIPGRKAEVPATSAKPAKGQDAGPSGSAKQPVGKVVKDRPAFGQKPKAVVKPPRHKKPRAKH